MADLPGGTVTFLFTDIEGSTQRWQQHPQAMPAAVARHDRLLREAIEAHHGVVFKTVGDAVCAAFHNAVDAVRAALTAQRALYAEPWGQTGPLRVRMALHTGIATPGEGDYAGGPLNRVARLLAAGHGGQVLLSGATAEVVQDHLPSEVHLRDLGTHQLKDLYRPERVFQLVTPDLPADFSPLSTAAHLPPYPARPDPAGDHAAPATPPRRVHRRATVLIGGLVVAVVLALSGIFFAATRGDSGTSPTLPVVAVLPTPSIDAGPTATVDPFEEGSGTWGILATPPTEPVFVVFGNLIFDAATQVAAQTLPGPMLVFVPPQPSPPTVWFGGAVTLTRYRGEATPGQDEAVAAGSYVELRPGDLFVVPAETSFAVQTGQYDPAALSVLTVFPSGPPAVAPDALYWEWWSWGTVESWPDGPVAVRFDSIQLEPGESTTLPTRALPQLIYVNSYTGPSLQLMLNAGGGETMPSGGFEGKEPIDLNAITVNGPGMTSTPSGNTALRVSRRPITPGVEAVIGGTLVSEAAFLQSGSGGTLRNPSDARDTISIIVISFGEPAAQL